MKTLFVDVDEVICQSEFLNEINKFLGTNYKINDFSDYFIDDILGSDENKVKFYEKIKNKNLYENPIIYDNAVEVLEKLNKKYDIYICSACVMFGNIINSGIYFKHKYNFLIKHFPFLNPEHFVFTNGKNIFNADIQIDDNIKNMQGNIKTKLMFNAYHNQNITDEELEKHNIKRVYSWNEIYEILK